jgi:hypothetical protein
MQRLISIVVILLLLSSITLAQDFCKGDFNYNGSVAAEDVTEFLNHFGRNQFNNPCPPDGPTPVAKTGQTTSYATGDDGDLERGVALVTPRFTDNLDGTITDNQTGLIWLKDANCFGQRTWNNAISDCNGLADGSCGLTDGSTAGDWRLANMVELLSLIDRAMVLPALPSGAPFTNVMLDQPYSSSTTHAGGTLNAWGLVVADGTISFGSKSASPNYVWPLRGGH